jgi:CRISPR system Cascade subunit CasB
MSVTPEHDDSVQSPKNKAARFVDGVMARCASDKGLAARLRRADNPNTEYQSWELLASFNIDLEKEYERLPYAVVSAAIARSKFEKNGRLKFGQAIASCYSNGGDSGNESAQAKARLRRLLACGDTSEVCRILRPLFALIGSKVSQPLDYARLLKQLLGFYWQPERIKAQWAQEFYGYRPVTTAEVDL